MIRSLVMPLLAMTAPVQTPDSIPQRLQAVADSVVRVRPRLPGILIHVESSKDDRSWTVAAGQSDTSRDRAMAVGQPLRIASVTKTYTATAVLRLVEKGIMALHDPIAKHLPPEFTALLERGGLRTDSITVEHLLSHRGGLDEHPSVPSYVPMALANPAKRWTRMEQVRWMVDSLKPVGPPGAQFRYSDTGYILLGAMIERYTGRSFGGGVRELIGFDRLGLRQTWFETLEDEPTGLPERVHQYMNGIDTFGHDPSLDLYGGGGVTATLSDVSAFFSALLTGRVFEQPATLDTMLAVRPGFMDGYGLGIFRVNTGGRRGFGHSGFWGVLVVHYPAEGLTIGVAVNEQSQGGAVFGVLSAVARAVLGPG